MRTTVDHLPGLTLTNITVEVPLATADPAAGTIEVFARVVTGEGSESKPYLVFLQGGPGNEAPRPSLGPDNPPWLRRALEDYQVVMLDQRGTGRSTPFGPSTSSGTRSSTSSGTPDPAGTAEYLTHLRADEIVNDCEAIREALGAKRWTVLGQSFGGFTALNYLSTHPESLDGALVTGGLSAVGRPIEDVYATTWHLMIGRSEQFYRRFPDDRARVRDLMAHAAAGEVVLPNGDAVSPAWLRTLGQRLGMQGGFEQVHHLIELDHRSPAFRHDLAAALPFGGRNPLYAVVHESSYADGVRTRWAADRTLPDRAREDVTLWAGEHLPRSLFAESSELAPFAETADLLAEHDWPRLYDRARLAQAEVTVAASVYTGDVFVPLDFSLETAALLPDCRTWVTSEYEHNGLRMGSDVLDRLIALLRGRRWL